MKFIKSILLSFAAVMMIGNLSSCQKADSEFEHTNNLISNMYMTIKAGGSGLSGVITEYNAQGEVVPAKDVTVESVAGGYGVIEFVVDLSLRGEYDPEHCYLNSSLTFDEIIKPGLGGVKDITNRDPETGIARGIEFQCWPGVGAPRTYKVIGYFDGEYQITPEN